MENETRLERYERFKTMLTAKGFDGDAAGLLEAVYQEGKKDGAREYRGATRQRDEDDRGPRHEMGQ